MPILGIRNIELIYWKSPRSSNLSPTKIAYSNLHVYSENGQSEHALSQRCIGNRQYFPPWNTVIKRICLPRKVLYVFFSKRTVIVLIISTMMHLKENAFDASFGAQEYTLRVNFSLHSCEGRTVETGTLLIPPEL